MDAKRAQYATLRDTQTSTNTGSEHLNGLTIHHDPTPSMHSVALAAAWRPCRQGATKSKLERGLDEQLASEDPESRRIEALVQLPSRGPGRAMGRARLQNRHRREASQPSMLFAKMAVATSHGTGTHLTHWSSRRTLRRSAASERARRLNAQSQVNRGEVYVRELLISWVHRS